MFGYSENIPDFVLTDSTNPFMRNVNRLRWIAAIYETPLWFPILLRYLGGRNAPTLRELRGFARGVMSGVQGKVLDVATGTATYGRHVASDKRTVFAIDILFEMLRKGREYSTREGVSNIHFSRANAEALPFADHTFDGCLFCGALHLFPDPKSTLFEVGRTLRPGSPIWVTTLVNRDDRAFQSRSKRKSDGKGEKMWVFQKSELPKMFAGVGFDRVETQAQGSLASITARKI